MPRRSSRSATRRWLSDLLARAWKAGIWQRCEHFGQVVRSNVKLTSVHKSGRLWAVTAVAVDESRWGPGKRRGAEYDDGHGIVVRRRAQHSAWIHR